MYMKFTLCVFTFLLFGNLLAQDLRYSIHAPPGARGAAQHLPDSIDTNHYYSALEIRDLAQPADGWEAFCNGMDSLVYPKEAKEKKLQTSMRVVFQINESGVVDSVFIASVENHGKWKKCAACENLILDYFKNTQWLAGKIGDIPVKTIDFTFIDFTIYDPKNPEKTANPFGH